ncbi:hypothetical protein IGB42_03306 [Andreprevotia sp. IGB-42]|uniref:biotin/lipoyl-containing protein n=1 Tax=Andreprevotia sp. IGB-42 TaxID=2497473 RepID=UPI00135B4440|nr:biotin/lipoyl-containing protein [Andreprevotia sp. IGB-42]KAF0812316.1 hypothetical protein IGB42_03306 [Andreprevotia sp. IGB-42]
MPEIISHMICAPEFDGAARVTELHVANGDWVPHDGKLATIAWEDGVAVVHAPDEGSVSSLLVAVGDELGSGELLLMMEIEEKDSGWLPDDLGPACAIPTLAAPPAPAPASASPQASRPALPAGDVLQVSYAAASLAARLGVDLGVVAPGASGVIDTADVERYVRGRLGGH